MGDDMRKLVRKLRRTPGVTLTQTRTGHLKVTTEAGTVTIPGTPSDSGRSVKNTVAQLRRIGVEV
jgi:hypothetical protein